MRAATASPWDGFRLWALMVVLLSPGERLPWCGSEIWIGSERACRRAPLRYRVKRRGRVHGRRVGENTVQREDAVSAVEYFGGDS